MLTFIDVKFTSIGPPFGLWASVWSKNRGGGAWAPRPLPWIRHRSKSLYC